jgi:hypothetical protein
VGRRCRQPRWLSAALPLWHSATLTLRFASRWLLILYKREFAPHDTMRLWEALWASKDKLMHLFYALAILRQHKHKIMEEEMEFDDVCIPPFPPNTHVCIPPLPPPTPPTAHVLCLNPEP